MPYDVIVIGGSYAGLSAALPLARARRSVLVIDAGIRRNRFAAAAHGFFGQDGRPPAEIAADGRAQLMEYPTVDWHRAQAVAARGGMDAFTVTSSDGATHTGRRLVLATGVSDELPDIPGLAERWGQQVFHCPYCHGYELQRGRIGVLARSEQSLHQALMLPDWGPTTFFLDDRFEPDAAQTSALAARGVTVVPGRVAALEGDAPEVRMTDGTRHAIDGLFLASRTEPGPLAAGLGCTLVDSPLGRYIRTDDMKETSVRGVFACGDVARGAGSIAWAVGDGATAGVATHRSLMFP